MSINKAEKDINYATKRIAELAKYAGKYFISNKITLSSNYKDIRNYKFPQTHIERQRDYKRIMLRKIKDIFNEEELQGIDFSLLTKDEGMFLNVTDHHGILNHPWVFTSNFLSHHDILFEKEKSNIPIIAMDSGNCPLGEFTHKRGFDFQGKHINLFPKALKNKLIYAAEKMDFNITERLVKSKKHTLFTQKELDFFKRVDDVIESIDFSGCKRYSDQIIKINFYLWPLLYEAKLRNRLLPLITLEHDEILITYLCEFLKNKESFVYESLFDANFRKIVLDKFGGNFSAWDEEKDYGTHFFWHINEKGVQERLFLSDENTLRSKSNFSMKLSPEEVIYNLSAKKIIPGMFLKFSVAVCYVGIVPLAGFGSVNYLSMIKSTWAEIMPGKYKKEIDLIKNIKTDGIVTMPLSFALDKNDSKVIDAYAFDVMYRGGFKESYLAKLDKMTFDELIRPTIPRSYSYYVYMYGGDNERKDIDFKNEALYEPMRKLFQ